MDELDQLFDEVEERRSYLDKLLMDAERQVRVKKCSVEFQQEAAKIQEILTKSQEDTELELNQVAVCPSIAVASVCPSFLDDELPQPGESKDLTNKGRYNNNVFERVLTHTFFQYSTTDFFF